jgi:hypothetical protein
MSILGARQVSGRPSIIRRIHPSAASRRRSPPGVFPPLVGKNFPNSIQELPVSPTFGALFDILPQLR